MSELVGFPMKTKEDLHFVSPLGKLQQTPAFGPFPGKFVAFAHIAMRTCQHKIAHIISRNVHANNTTYRISMIDMIDVPALVLLKLGMTTCGVIAMILLTYQLLLNLFRGMCSFNALLADIAIATSCPTMHKAILSFRILLPNFRDSLGISFSPRPVILQLFCFYQWGTICVSLFFATFLTLRMTPVSMCRGFCELCKQLAQLTGRANQMRRSVDFLFFADRILRTLVAIVALFTLVTHIECIDTADNAKILRYTAHMVRSLSSSVSSGRRMLAHRFGSTLLPSYYITRQPAKPVYSSYGGILWSL